MTTTPSPPATWTGKTALVTGAAIRIGAAIARTLAARGIHLVLHYRSSQTEAEALAAELAATGIRATPIQGHLDSETGCQDLFTRATQAAGPLDLLVNNASAFNKHPLSAITQSALLGEFWPNLFAPVLLTRHFAAQHRPGVIVNLLDRRVESNDPTCIPYLLSKKGLADFTRASALALAPRIRVYGVAPGPILPPPGESPNYLKERAGRVPLDYYPTPHDIAHAVSSCLDFPGTTGQTIYVDGGQHLLGNGVA
ncbi:MAG TPA: SDR family NAD(P)-dependent oxidoreductase [Kiritimatiellia bacterium]|nr:SDR family NAD(P)-dependent oxidoreductase [Kiritimatiellia bacterium]